MPTVTGLVFGTYTFELQVTDGDGHQSTQTLQVGVVATDANGVVMQSNPNADLLFGPMIAFGRNPWGYQDARAIYATTQRNVAYDAYPGNPPAWIQALPGTVSYPFAPVSTILARDITATSTSIIVTDASKLDFTSLPGTPTVVYVNGLGGEEVRICSASGNTLNVCYDGRGWRYGTPFHTAAQSWNGGMTVTQQKVTGSGTSLLATFNPAGPGWSGPMVYHAGTVAATANSAMVTLSGGDAAWVACNSTRTSQCLSPGSDAIRISGTHGGTPFAFFAYIIALDSPTSITMNRVYPADADTASGLTYAVIRPDYTNMVLHYRRCGPGSYSGCITNAYPYDGSTYFQTTGCESDTTCYLYETHDPDAVHPTTSTCLGFSGMECNVHVSLMNGSGYVGDNGGANFYDEGLAHMAFYLRSGWQPALDAFRKLEGQDGTGNTGWMFWPEMAQGDIGVGSRRASITGAWAAYLFDNKQSNLSGLRNFASMAVGNISDSLGCNDDLREGLAYPASWLALAALFDPDASSLGWITQLGEFYARREAACQVTGRSNSAENSSWRSGFLWNNNQTPPLTATNGSAVLTAQSGSISPDICPMIARGTATVTSRSDAVTGAGFVNSPGKIMFEGTIGGKVAFLTFAFIYDSPTRIHLSGLYPGDTASGVVWQIDYDSIYGGGNPDSGLVFGSSSADPTLRENWACTRQSSTEITLDRPWDGPTETVWGWRAALGGVGLAGNGTQPFMLGINTLALGYGAHQSGGLGANYNALAYAASNWIKNYGYDPVSGGLYYGRLFGMCEPVFADSSQPQNFLRAWRNPECSYNGSSTTGVPTNVPSMQFARALSGEAQNAARINYQNDPTPSNQAFWDTFYCHQWDRPGYTAPGYGCDGIGASNLDDTSLSGGKWTGFFFGVGMSYQWPAARLQAIAPTLDRKLSVGFDLAVVANAVAVDMILTSPAGVVSHTRCSSSPCEVGADERQGSHVIEWKYLDRNGRALARSEPMTMLVQ
ncbi:MAG: hypothetical protein ABSH47_17445 [Bryobacteraceae bacterium]